MNNETTELRILFAGGGTGGHLFPALAIADTIRKQHPTAAIWFVGTRKKIEARIVPKRGYGFETIWISGLQRSLEPANVLFPVKVIVSLVQSFLILRRCRPQVVVGTGGYVCGPVVFVASLMRIPTLLQEQNSYPGMTTRLLASRATEVHLTFEISRVHFTKQDNLHVSGNPTRSELGTISRSEGARAFNLNPMQQTVLVVGGSLGASSLNQATTAILHDLIKQKVQLLWQTGEKGYDQCAAAVSRAGKETKDLIRLRKFIDRMEYAYAASDLVVCRAGATTIAELTRVGVPSILVPYPAAAADHQTENAKAMVEAEAAVLLNDADIKNKLGAIIIDLLRSQEKRDRMAAKAKSLAKPDAAQELANRIIELAQLT
ncbi:MAG TPA: undecaprenyldiphospho-muramoylpentapeptide beta-N-acetylglucosaminyltransferase [Bacteroidota bacterium]